MLNKALTWSISLPRWAKKTIVLCLDIALCFAAAWLAFCLRFDDVVGISETIILAGGVSAVLIIPIFIALGLYRAIFRFSGWYATMSLIKAVSFYAFVYALIFLVFGVSGVPRSIGLIQPVLLFLGVGATRLLAKWLLNAFVVMHGNSDRKTVALIYGAGSAGRQLASGLRQGYEIEPIGFVDDDQRLWNGMVNGLMVYAP